MADQIHDALFILLRIGAAAVLGGLIGFERDKHGRAAGLRTHLLVSMGAAVFTVISTHVAGQSHAEGFTADPGRIAAQIIAGIGFLGAGVILKSGNHVRGLTTAACLWTAAAVGMAAGAGYFVLSVMTTGLALVSLILLKFFERTYAKDAYRTLTVVTGIETSASTIIDLVKKANVSVLSCDIERNYVEGQALARLSVRLYHKGITDKRAHGIIESIESAGVGIREVKWTNN
ncbi:MAG TPA: MgtC/SapB family protein [Candidatus Krumholzibacteria bacterium]|nr:MgtC/SapB family protein [Candidatus Krumholzibacteria bacterium]